MLALRQVHPFFFFFCCDHINRAATVLLRGSPNNIIMSKKRPHTVLEGHADDNKSTNDTKQQQQYFLLKSEPDEYSITKMREDKTEEWGGIRNYQARNFLRSMNVDDRAFFYHSKTKPQLTGIVGTVRVARTAQPDKSAYDPRSEYYDPKCTADSNNKWSSVLVEYERTFPVVLTLNEIKETAANDPDSPIATLALLKQSRLSVVPLTKEQWDEVMRMIEKKVGGDTDSTTTTNNEKKKK
jgi:predicted RNA-binding protein with PUA-like domain